MQKRAAAGSAGLPIAHPPVGDEDDGIARADQVGVGAVDADLAAAAFAGDDVGEQAIAVSAIADARPLIWQGIGGLQERGIHRDRADAVEVGRGGHGAQWILGVIIVRARVVTGAPMPATNAERHHRPGAGGHRESAGMAAGAEGSGISALQRVRGTRALSMRRVEPTRAASASSPWRGSPCACSSPVSGPPASPSPAPARSTKVSGSTMAT